VRGALGVHLAEQNGYVFVGYGPYTSCGDRIVAGGDQPVSRSITNLSVVHMGTIPAGRTTITWSPVPAATFYCVMLWGMTDNAWITPDPCDPAYGAPAARVTSSQYTTPPLGASKMYSLTIAAMAGPTMVGYLPQGNVTFTAR
jgi:hypothetical protein